MNGIDPKEKAVAGNEAQESTQEETPAQDVSTVFDDAGAPMDTSERTYVSVEGVEEGDPS